MRGGVSRAKEQLNSERTKLDSFLSPTRLPYIHIVTLTWIILILWQQNSGGPWYISIFHSFPTLAISYLHFCPQTSNTFYPILTKRCHALYFREVKRLFTLSSHLHLHIYFLIYYHRWTIPASLSSQCLLLCTRSHSFSYAQGITNIYPLSLLHHFFLSTESFLTARILFLKNKEVTRHPQTIS